MGCSASAAGFAPGVVLGLGLAVGWHCGMAISLDCCLAVGLGHVWAFGSGLTAGLGFAGGRCRPALPVAGCGATGVLAATGALAARTSFGPRVGGVARGRGAEVLGEAMVVEEDEVVMLVEVGKSWHEALEEVDGLDRKAAEANDMDLGDAVASFHSGAFIWVLWARTVRVRVWASGVVRRPAGAGRG